MGAACLEQRWQSCGSTVPTQCRGHVAYGSKAPFDRSADNFRSSPAPYKRTIPDPVGMSQTCKQTYSPQPSSPHSIIIGEQLHRIGPAL